MQRRYPGLPGLSGPAHTRYDSHRSHGGPAQRARESQVPHGGPAQLPGDSQEGDGGPAHTQHDSQRRVNLTVYTVSGILAVMNLHEYILSYSLADGDPEQIALSYIGDVLDLPDREAQIAALEPSVRPHASRLASAIRRAQRASGPAQQMNDSQVSDGGPAQAGSGNQRGNGGPAHTRGDSQTSRGGPLIPEWARTNAALISYCRQHASDHYFVPKAGRRKLDEITADEWLARERWLTQQSEGAAKSARQSRALADLIVAAGGVTIGDVLARAGDLMAAV